MTMTHSCFVGLSKNMIHTVHLGLTDILIHSGIVGFSRRMIHSLSVDFSSLVIHCLRSRFTASTRKRKQRLHRMAIPPHAFGFCTALTTTVLLQSLHGSLKAL